MAARYALVGSGSGARPVPRKLKPNVDRICAESGTWINSALRTQAAVNFARKRGASLSSQAELYYGYVARRPGYNPANPPGRSTHERRSDGVAYAVPAGLPLRWWQCGLDIGGPGSSRQNAEAFCRAARRHGWIATITYPSSPLEQHHVNFRRKPRRIPKPLKVGSRGKRVERYSRRLWFIRRHGHAGLHYPIRGKKHVFDREMKRAVRWFQRDHDLAQDGVIGPHTAAAIDQVFRAQWRNRGKRA